MMMIQRILTQISFFGGVFILLFFTLLRVTPAYAADYTCNFSTDPSGNPIVGKPSNIRLGFNCTGLIDYLKSKFSTIEGDTFFFNYPTAGCPNLPSWTVTSDNLNSFNNAHFGASFGDQIDVIVIGGFPIPLIDCQTPRDYNQHTVQLVHHRKSGSETVLATGNYEIASAPNSCDFSASYGGDGTVTDTTWQLHLQNIKLDQQYPAFLIQVSVKTDEGTQQFGFQKGSDGISYNIPVGPMHDAGKHDVLVYPASIVADRRGITGYRIASTVPMCQGSYYIYEPGEPTHTPTPSPSITPTPPAHCAEKEARDNKICTDPYDDCPWCQPSRPPIAPLPELGYICETIDPELKDACQACMGTKISPSRGIWTALGCLPTDYGKLMNENLFPLLIGLGGGTSFLYFLYGAFLVLTAAGNAEQVAQAKQIITSAISGLLLIIFSIFFLKVIGVDILQLPEFG